MEKEVWRDIKGYEGLYQVSNLGRIKSKETLIKNGICSYVKKERVKKQTITKLSFNENYSYYSVNLCKNGKCKTYRSHVIVAEAFLKKENKNLEVNHIDFNPLNNNIKNLEWVTHQENLKYSLDAGRKYKIDINEVVSLSNKGMKILDIAKKMGFTKNGIYYALRTRCPERLKTDRKTFDKI